MAGRRQERVAEAIRETVASSIIAELKDPRIRNVTVLGAEVSADLRHAKVHVSLMGDDTEQRLVLKGLEHARGFLQSRIAKRLQTKWTPVIQFVVDESIKKSIEISQLIDQVRAEREKNDQPVSSESESESTGDLSL